MELGARIKSLRTQRGLSQEALAGQLEVSHQAVAKWESGKSQHRQSAGPLRGVWCIAGCPGVRGGTRCPGAASPGGSKPPSQAGRSDGAVRHYSAVLLLFRQRYHLRWEPALPGAGHRRGGRSHQHPGLRAVHPRPSGGGIPPVGYHGGAGASDRPCILAGTETVTSWTCGPGIKKQLGSISPAAFSFTLFYC